jgi:CheY-like chemotaxis protein
MPSGLDERHVLADRQRLRQVLLNLLSNAIKYNRRGGLASVLVQDVDAERVRILVRDEGAGIPADRIERLFVPFDRLGAETGEIEGTGLGLSLSKRLVELMGGTLSVETSEGHGSTFVVELRTAAARPATADMAVVGSAISAEAPIAPATILYVEDNASNIRLAEIVLAGRGAITLIPAMQGSLALELARQHKPDLILLDLHLPDMPGTEVLERLQADPATRGVPVVILSADATARRSLRLLDKGARDYLVKPLDLARFVATVTTILNER